MINEVRQTVLAIANKNNYGYIPPEDFNNYARHAQMDAFKEFFYDYNDQVNRLNKRVAVNQSTAVSAATNEAYGDLAERKRQVIEIFSEIKCLDNIASIELGEKKLDYSEQDSLYDLYKNDWEKFIDYNIKDVELITKLDDKMGLIEQVFAIAYDAKVNYQDCFTSLRMWDLIIHNHLADKGIVVPQLKVGHKDNKIEGAYVKEPEKGMHDWVVSFDLNSLYPHLIQQYNISPETWVGKIGEAPSIEDIIGGAFDKHKKQLEEENQVLAPSGDVYTKDFQGFLPYLMSKMYDDRVVWFG